MTEKEQQDLAALFSTQLGRKVLNDLTEQYLTGMLVADPKKDSNHAYFNEGKRFVIRSFTNTLKSIEEK